MFKENLSGDDFGLSCEVFGSWIPTLWTLIDTCDDGISWDALDDWMPPDVLNVLQSTWLRQTSNSELIICPEFGRAHVFADELQHQSYRKAAEELSRQTGQKIRKDKVARAVAAMEDS